MYTTIGPLTPIDIDMVPLMPAPGVRDLESMPAPTSDAGLNDVPLLIIWNYRGYLLYLENGASVYRDNPKSAGGNGLLSDPTGPEDCIVSWCGKAYRAIVDFNINVGPKAPQA